MNRDLPDRDLLDRWIYRGLLLLLLWSPLPFGSVESWSRAILQIGAFLLLLFWSLQIARGRAGKLARMSFAAELLTHEEVD